MRSDDRNYREDYNYPSPRYESDRRRGEERVYGSRRGMSGQYYDRDYDRGSMDLDRDRDSYGRREFDREAMQRSSREYEQGRNRNLSGEGNYGRFRSTETDVPGRGYESEREMNRHANNYVRGREGDRRYDERNRGYRSEPYSGVASSHSATGPYEDYERDIDRYGLRQDYQDGYPTYNPAEYDRGQRHGREGYRNENRSFSYRPGEEAERRRRLSARIQDRGLERSPSGNWGPSESPYNRRRYKGEKGW